ncbi:hypothetical protein [Desulfovibrio inopinatus]|uniref:hypothetical protein n=1 Tax=Desulfovibrio inopinatus TaxID=102109 RepID=UPI00041BDE6A|nr:hypothetical protein [Desulfovibrio inopinatus]
MSKLQWNSHRGMAWFSRTVMVLGIAGMMMLGSVLHAQAKCSTIKFKRGAYSASLENGIARGEHACYELEANAGQMMEVIVSSVEQNAVFNLYGPKGGLITSDAANWRGRLAVSGNYKIDVGAMRGGSDYKLTVIIQ